jgi:PIN domain nuclease of toxin-antitoxin system
VKLLLDTHAFLWWSGEPERLSDQAREACADAGNDLLLSIISILEIQLKLDAGKLEIDQSLEHMVREHESADRLKVLPLRPAHVYALGDLPRIHGDPFDRLLIAQAVVEGAVLASGDDKVAQYPVKVLW